MTMYSLAGKVAVVTASTRGIGPRLRGNAGRKRATVFVAARNEESGNAVAASMSERGWESAVRAL